jgi:hypothetical protein
VDGRWGARGYGTKGSAKDPGEATGSELPAANAGTGNTPTDAKDLPTLEHEGGRSLSGTCTQYVEVVAGGEVSLGFTLRSAPDTRAGPYVESALGSAPDARAGLAGTESTLGATLDTVIP